MRYKRWIALGLAAALTCTGLPGGAVFAQEAPAAGQERLQAGDALEDSMFQYRVLEDGKLSVEKAKDAASATLAIPAEVGGYAVSNLDGGAFEGCTALREVTLPSGIQFEGNPFYDCDSLEAINLASDDPNYVVADGVLYDRQMERLIFCSRAKSGSLAVPETVKAIEGHALKNCGGLTEVTLQEGLLEIGAFAFGGCSGLKEIHLPDSLEYVWQDAFWKCASLKQVSLPKNVDGFGQRVFGLCSQLESITVDADNPHYTAQDGILYSKDMAKLLYVPAQAKGSYALPESVVEIGPDALSDADSLETIRIHKGALLEPLHSAWMAFQFCGSLQDIAVEEGHPGYCSKDGMVFTVGGDELILCPGGRMDPVVPEGTVKVGSMAFCYVDRESGAPIPREAITFPASVKEIVSLHKEYVKLMVVERESYAESYAKEHGIPYRYADGSYPGQPDPGSGQPIEGQGFLYQELEDGALEITGYKGEETELTIPSSLPVSSEAGERPVSRIGERAFANSYGLEKVELPQTVTEIGQGAFENCISLKEVGSQQRAALPAGEEGPKAQEGGSASHRAAQGSVVGKGAFQNCISLTSVTLPDGIAELGEMAFQGCARLQEIRLPDSLASVGREAFGGCESLAKLTLPGQVAEIGEAAFQGCIALAELPLPESLRSIGRFAFADCARLTELSLPERLERIGYGAFQGCPEKLVLGVAPGSYAKEYAMENGMEYRYTRACAHNYAYQVTKKATCTEAGERLYTCTVCEENYLEPVAALGHSYKTTVNQASPKKEGSIVTQCEACGDILLTKIDAVKGMSLSKVKYTWNGKAQKPGVTVTDSKSQELQEGKDYTVSYAPGRKSPGRYTVTVRLTGNYSGSLQAAFTIIPKGASISKVTAKKKAFSMKWKKQASQITGYEIQYSTSKAFAKKSTVTLLSSKKAVSRNVSKLKAKKKYYVRIRTYKNVKVNGKATKLSSGWSKVKAVTTKE